MLLVKTVVIIEPPLINPNQYSLNWRLNALCPEELRIEVNNFSWGWGLHHQALGQCLAAITHSTFLKECILETDLKNITQNKQSSKEYELTIRKY